MKMLKKKVFIAGHNGMVGSAILRRLQADANITLVLASRSELNLLNAKSVKQFFEDRRPDEVYLAAARVGGIYANSSFPAEFISQNLQIQNNIIQTAHDCSVQRLLFLGSSCIYPKLAAQPIVEESLLTGPLEPTNEPYAIAKIAGIKMCESFNRQYDCDYRSVMPTNLYGTNDNFHPQNSHVIPAMMQRFHHAMVAGDSEAVVWGSGKPMREFLHVDDMAAACVHLMNLSKDEFMASVPNPMCSHINVGTGTDVTIAELANLMAKTVGFKGALIFDSSKPDGTMRKVMDVGRLNSLGWSSHIGLTQGLAITYKWFVEQQGNIRM